MRKRQYYPLICMHRNGEAPPPMATQRGATFTLMLVFSAPQNETERCDNLVIFRSEP